MLFLHFFILSKMAKNFGFRYSVLKSRRAQQRSISEVVPLKSLNCFIFLVIEDNSRGVSCLMVKQQFSSPASVVGIDELS